MSTFNAEIYIGNRGNTILSFDLYLGTGTTQNYNCNSDSGVTFNSTIHSGTTRVYQNVLWSDMYSGQTLFVDSIPMGTTHIKVVANRLSGVCNNLQPQIICIQGRPTPTPTNTPTPTPTPLPCSFNATIVYGLPPTPTPTSTPIPPTSTPNCVFDVVVVIVTPTPTSTSIVPTPTPTPTSTSIVPTPTPTDIPYYLYNIGASNLNRVDACTNFSIEPLSEVYATTNLPGSVTRFFIDSSLITPFIGSGNFYAWRLGMSGSVHSGGQVANGGFVTNVESC